MKTIIRYIILLGTFLCCAANAAAQQEDGGRSVEFGLQLTSELQVTDKGNFNNANLLRLGVSVPVSSSICFEAASISTYMTASESIGSDMQTFSNIDADKIPFALSVCGVSWTFPSPSQGKSETSSVSEYAQKRGGSHTLFMGIRNMNEDYFCSDATSFFTNSSCGIYPTISTNYPIANYPYASVGIHYRYEKSITPSLPAKKGENDLMETPSITGSDGVRLQVSLYNGTGHNRFTGRSNIFRFCPKSGGIFGITEVSYTHRGNSYFLGNALYYKDGISTTPWFYTEQSITPHLTLLAGCSHAFATEAECKNFVGLGALYKLGKCQLGAFTDYANFTEGNEFATEVSCKIPILQYLDIQPTVHLASYDGIFQCAGTLRVGLHI